MKSIFLIILFVSSVTVKSQTLRDSLLSINLNYYLDKPVDSLLNVLPSFYDSIYTRSGSSMFVGATVILNCSSKFLWVNIYPYTHNFLSL